MLLYLRYEATKASALSQENEELREALLHQLIDRKLRGTTMQLIESDTLDPNSLPFRELPPGNISSLYLMYVAWMRVTGDEVPASKSTFYNVAHSWENALGFRRKCEHAQCVICQTLKIKIRDTNAS